MYECLFGYTPFACEDRRSTKLKILKHKISLVFPGVDHERPPSAHAIDVILRLLTDKELV